MESDGGAFSWRHPARDAGEKAAPCPPLLPRQTYDFFFAFLYIYVLATACDPVIRTIPISNALPRLFLYDS